MNRIEIRWSWWCLCVSLWTGTVPACAPTALENPAKDPAAIRQDRKECSRNAVREVMAMDPYVETADTVHDREAACLQERGDIERPPGQEAPRSQ